MITKTNENLAENDLVSTDDTGKSISDTDITDIQAHLVGNVLTISWSSMTLNDTIVQQDEGSGETHDPSPPKGVTQFQITEGQSVSSKQTYSKTFDNMGSVGSNIFVWTESETEEIEDDKTDRGTVVPVQES